MRVRRVQPYPPHWEASAKYGTWESGMVWARQWPLGYHVTVIQALYRAHAVTTPSPLVPGEPEMSKRTLGPLYRRPWWTSFLLQQRLCPLACGRVETLHLLTQIVMLKPASVIPLLHILWLSLLWIDFCVSGTSFSFTSGSLCQFLILINDSSFPLALNFHMFVYWIPAGNAAVTLGWRWKQELRRSISTQTGNAFSPFRTCDGIYFFKKGGDFE